MLVSIPPRISAASFMGYLKVKCSNDADKHANLKYKFGNRHFWAEGYKYSWPQRKPHKEIHSGTRNEKILPLDVECKEVKILSDSGGTYAS